MTKKIKMTKIELVLHYLSNSAEILDIPSTCESSEALCINLFKVQKWPFENSLMYHFSLTLS